MSNERLKNELRERIRRLSQRKRIAAKRIGAVEKMSYDQVAEALRDLKIGESLAAQAAEHMKSGVGIIDSVAQARPSN